jgi:hypothetical protein
MTRSEVIGLEIDYLRIVMKIALLVVRMTTRMMIHRPNCVRRMVYFQVHESGTIIGRN